MWIQRFFGYILPSTFYEGMMNLNVTLLNNIQYWYDDLSFLLYTCVCFISATYVYVFVCWMHKQSEMCTGLSFSECLALLHPAVLSVTVMGRESRG